MLQDHARRQHEFRLGGSAYQDWTTMMGASTRDLTRPCPNDAGAADEHLINKALAHQRIFCDTRAIKSSVLERNSFKIRDVFELL